MEGDLVTKKRQGLVVALSLTGKYRDVATNIDLQSLDSEDGMETLLRKMDEKFKRDDIDCAFEYYQKFESFRRGNKSMSDFILEFEKLNERLISKGLTLPDNILGCKLLEVAELQPTQKQMVLSAVTKLDFDDMDRALKRIFGCASDFNNESLLEPKTEADAFIAYKRGRKYQPQMRGRGSKTNPYDRTGKPSKCRLCGSIFHWQRDCPRKQNESFCLGISSQIKRWVARWFRRTIR